MKKQLIFLLLCFLMSSNSIFASNNPIADFYNGVEGYPVWVNEVNWNNVITMTNKTSGAANFAEFKAQRDILYAQGGGVLYYPAGTYIFNIPDGPNDEGLMLKKGVVIVGETPAADKVAVTGKNTTTGQVDLMNHGLGNMPTKFKFTRRLSDFGTATDSIPKMWNCIGQTKGANETSLSQNSHMGISWIEMEFGYIYFGMDFSDGWASTWGYPITTPATFTSYTGGLGKQLNGWDARIPNGTHFMDPFSATKVWASSVGVVASKIFVFGVKMTNCTPPNYVCNRIKQAKWKQENGGWRFGARIGIDAKNVFVANNVIDYPTACFGYQAPTSAQNTTPASYKWLVYDYANAIGIDVNKNLVSACANRALVNQQEGFYEPNVIIRDNWIYNHGNKGIDVAGTWVVVKGNVNYRHHLGLSVAYPYVATDQLHYAFDGWSYSTAESSADLLARFIDYGGHNVWFDDNRWCGTGSRGNDGEGILSQRNNAIEVYSVAITNNKQADLNNGESGYIGPWDTYVIGLFQGWNNIMGNVGANICGVKANYGQDISNIENYGLNGTTPSPLFCGPSTIVTTLTGPQDWQSGCPASTPTTPTISKLVYNSTTSAVEIEWSDVANETAYRVDRRKVGTTDWYTIAFRPRTETFKDNTVTIPKPAANTGDGLDARSYPLQVNLINLRNWNDYTAVNGNYEYRVAAISCTKDDATYATAAQAVGTTAIYSPSALVVPMTVHPNPINNTATVNFNLAKGVSTSITLVDLNGKMVMEIGTKLTNKAEFTTENIANGMYFLRLVDSKGQSSVTKVLIQK
ncbi:MAG: T9SS type A sorting domain-containing protein [Paludibacter sp.]